MWLAAREEVAVGGCRFFNLGPCHCWGLGLALGASFVFAASAFAAGLMSMDALYPVVAFLMTGAGVFSVGYLVFRLIALFRAPRKAAVLVCLEPHRWSFYFPESRSPRLPHGTSDADLERERLVIEAAPVALTAYPRVFVARSDSEPSYRIARKWIRLEPRPGSPGGYRQMSGATLPTVPSGRLKPTHELVVESTAFGVGPARRRSRARRDHAFMPGAVAPNGQRSSASSHSPQTLTYAVVGGSTSHTANRQNQTSANFSSNTRRRSQVASPCTAEALKHEYYCNR